MKKNKKQKNPPVKVSQLEGKGPFQMILIHSHLLSSGNDNEDIHLQDTNDVESPPTLHIGTQPAAPLARVAQGHDFPTIPSLHLFTPIPGSQPESPLPESLPRLN